MAIQTVLFPPTILLLFQILAPGLDISQLALMCFHHLLLALPVFLLVEYSVVIILGVNKDNKLQLGICD